MDRNAPCKYGLTIYPYADNYPFMDNSTAMHEALIACRAKAGSDSQMARDLGVPQSTMWRWLNQLKRLPAEYVLRAERLYGVSRNDLRPDIYPDGKRRMTARR